MHVSMHACVCATGKRVRGLLLALELLKGALCAAISLWDFSDWQQSPETKQFVHFLETNEQVSQSKSVTNGWRGKERESEGVGMCITELC